MAQTSKHCETKAAKRSSLFIGLSAALLLSSSLTACAPAATNTETATASQAEGERDGEILVSTQAEYEDAVKSLEAGDTIVLANGRWENFEILFAGEGTEEQPIRLRAETPGEVFLTGQSNLRLAGEWLDVSGLIFTDGFTPTREVISFRRNKDHLANNSRVHNVVIDDYNPTERTSSDFWVMIYGKNNRFDHKNTEESRENNHRIDHNYFGPRPILGSNGGETLRIGTTVTVLPASRIIILIGPTAKSRLSPPNPVEMFSAIIHFINRAAHLLCATAMEI